MRSRLVLGERGIEAVAHFTCPSRMISKALHFVVDTGSELSFLGWKDAILAGIEVESLPAYPRPVAGFGGAAEAKHLRDPCFVYLDFDDTLKQVELPNGMLVYRPSRTKTKHWRIEESVSILGRDFIRNSGSKLVVDLANDEAYFEG